MGREKLYFAYGSNLNRGQMERRCPRSKVYCKGVLEEYTLIFRRGATDVRPGVADVVPCVGGKVFGGLYTLTPQDIDSLDCREGVTHVYQRGPCEVKVREEIVPAFFYYMNPEFLVKKPCRSYYEKIVDGYEKWGIELRYLEDALSLTLELDGRNHPADLEYLQGPSFGARRT